MKWEQLASSTRVNAERTPVECPTCGSLLYVRTDMVLTTYPVQYRYECPKCQFVGTGPMWKVAY